VNNCRDWREYDNGEIKRRIDGEENNNRLQRKGLKLYGQMEEGRWPKRIYNWILPGNRRIG
jgi:hypothetical protein